MVKVCVICGADFLCSPSDKKVTCGQKACISERRRQTHLGLSPKWSNATKQRKAALGQTSNLKMGTAAARQSPVAGPFETNQEAKLWWIISPEGTRYHLRNLRKFCRDHPHLFAPDPWPNAYAGLRQVIMLHLDLV